MCSARTHFKSTLITAKTLPRLVIKLQIITLTSSTFQPKMRKTSINPNRLFLHQNKITINSEFSSENFIVTSACKTPVNEIRLTYTEIIIGELFQRHHLWIQLSQPRHITKEALTASGFHGNSRGFHLNCHIKSLMSRRSGTLPTLKALLKRFFGGVIRSITCVAPISW